MNQDKDSKKNTFIPLLLIILLCMIVVTVICVSFLAYDNIRSSGTERLKSNGVAWDGEREIQRYGKQDYIQIKGFRDLHFLADTKQQRVNFYNSQENDCMMDMEIIVDDEVIWKEENIAPGYGLYDITLNRAIDAGVYLDCRYLVHCHTDDGTTLNSINIGFILYVDSEE